MFSFRALPMNCVPGWRSGITGWLVALVLGMAVSGCVGSGSENIIGLVDGAPSSTQSPLTTRQIFLATTRSRSDDPAEFFSGERAGILSLGEATVTIPPTHETGQIEKPKSGKPDPSKHFVVRTPVLFDNKQQFESELRSALQEREPGKRDILVFVHGYNVNFSAAVLRVAQFVNDTGYEGVTVLFSWASRGKTFDYVYDINSALQARDALQELGGMLVQMPAENADLVAHSMGNLLVLETLVQLEQQGLLGENGRLRRVILASPDIDVDLFETQLSKMDNVKDRFYVLVSADDRALSISRRIAGGVSRVGASDPDRIAQLGVNVIDLSEVEDTTSTHHTKFASAPDVVQLIGSGMLQSGGLSAQTEPDVLNEITTEMVRGITFIPSVLLTGKPLYLVDATPGSGPVGR
jgi:esterase/lipase superfamily enzyme